MNASANLMQRIRDGRTDLVFDWVSGGHSASSTDEQGVPLLEWCAYYSDVSAIRFLIGRGEMLQSLGENLVAYGANPNCVTKRDADTGAFMRDCRTKAETPLHRAAAFGTEEAIQLLLDAGAVVDAKDMNGDSPLAWASWHLRPDSILRKLCYGDFSIHSARRSTYDHGVGWGIMGRGQPHVPKDGSA